MSDEIRRIGPGPDGLAASLRELWSARELLWALAWRSFRVRYKQSLLGLFWAVAHPVALMLVFTLVFDRIVGVGSEGVPYPLFSYAALLPWTFFATGTSLAMLTLVNQVALVTKVYFPREVLPLGSLLASTIDFLIALALFAFLSLAYGRAPGPSWLLTIPLFAVQLLLTAGVSLFVAALNVRFRDVKYIVPLAMQVWLYASPVIYPLEAVPAGARPYYVLNPVVGIVDGYRAVLLHGRAPDPALLATSSVGALLVLVLGWIYFHRVESHFADVV